MPELGGVQLSVDECEPLRTKRVPLLRALALVVYAQASLAALQLASFKFPCIFGMFVIRTAIRCSACWDTTFGKTLLVPKPLVAQHGL